MENDDTSMEPRLRIEAKVARDINLALAQNFVPIIRDLALVNPKGFPELEDLTLRVSPEPAFCQPMEVTIDRLGEASNTEAGNAFGGRVALDGETWVFREFLRTTHLSETFWFQVFELGS